MGDALGARERRLDPSGPARDRVQPGRPDGGVRGERRRRLHVPERRSELALAEQGPRDHRVRVRRAALAPRRVPDRRDAGQRHAPVRGRGRVAPRPGRRRRRLRLREDRPTDVLPHVLGHGNGTLAEGWALGLVALGRPESAQLVQRALLSSRRGQRARDRAGGPDGVRLRRRGRELDEREASGDVRPRHGACDTDAAPDLRRHGGREDLPARPERRELEPHAARPAAKRLHQRPRRRPS